ncbi:MAG: hypothetical protein ACR2NP_21545 [Pirellulaceae bacterium]
MSETIAENYTASTTSKGRLPGWIAHWKEMQESEKFRICRPRQVYTGENERQFIPLDNR